MDLKTVKPLHGWRAFFGEVGVIVIGVLLALVAQQVAQDIQNRGEERAFRETIDHEIGLNLFMYDVRARQFGCDANHVAELQNWLTQVRSGAQVPAILALGPATVTPYRSAWETRDAQVFNRLPREVRQKYAEFYDELENNWSDIQTENRDWGSLAPYREPGPISLEDRRAIRTIIGRIGNANETLEANVPISRKIARLLKVKAVQPDNLPADWLKHLPDCRSIIVREDQ